VQQRLRRREIAQREHQNPERGGESADRLPRTSGPVETDEDAAARPGAEGEEKKKPRGNPRGFVTIGSCMSPTGEGRVNVRLSTNSLEHRARGHHRADQGRAGMGSEDE
jgi:hypothetical protein